MKSIRGAFALLLALSLVSATALMVKTPAAASPADLYAPAAPYFGDGNLPPGCEDDPTVDEMKPELLQPDTPAHQAARAAAECHHMRTGLNELDSPQVDVLVMVPVTPAVERDMRIMRQSVEMWEGGIDYLAEEMGLGWLAQGVDFHITLQYVDLQTGAIEFNPYPVSDPEIVVIGTTNPVGGVGIGIDPVDFLAAAGFTDDGEGPCLPVQNPFDFEEWEEVPAFDNHHGESGTYEEDCGGSGGNVCFAINSALDPAPDLIEVISLFDLVSHEFGHCLTLGHVGDGAEGPWGVVPTNDIMAYDNDPPGLNKCVSTLDVEAFAVRMSRYLDSDGVGGVGPTLATNVAMDDNNPFQVQHPRDHLYASGTGDPMGCPQPDLGLVPTSQPTDWTPTPIGAASMALTLTGPDDGSVSEDGVFTVTGTAGRVLPDPEPVQPTRTFADPGDGTTPVTQIEILEVDVDASQIEATLTLAELPPTNDAPSQTSYSLIIDGRKFDSFIVFPGEFETWDNSAAVYPASAHASSEWFPETKTVVFRISREYLDPGDLRSRYVVAATSNFGSFFPVRDDTAPDGRELVGDLDTDGDRVPNASDDCDTEFGDDPLDGCALEVDEEVSLLVGGAPAFTQAIDTSAGPAPFELPVGLAEGTHNLRVDWQFNGDVVASRFITLTHEPVLPPPPGPGPGPDVTDDGDSPLVVDRPPAGTRPPGATPDPTPEIDEAILTRVQGIDRIATSVAASRSAFTDRSAEVAVIARADNFADGLAGTSLAVSYGGPVLLTPSGGLDARVADELVRVLGPGSTVFVLGGPAAVSPDVDTRLKNLGYSVTRLAGKDRFDTAVLVARAQPRHETILVATGQNFADALAAGSAAAEARGTVVLTNDGSLPQSTADYLAEHPGADIVAIGGPAAAALPDAEHLVGSDRFETSVMVAQRFFRSPQLLGLASGVAFPDALSGGALLGRFRGPVILTAPTQLSGVVLDYLNANQASVDDLFVIGGEAAVANAVVEDALEALRT